MRRFHAEGAPGLADRSRQSHCCPQRTPTTLEEKIVRLNQQTGFGRERLSRLLWHQERLAPSPNTPPYLTEKRPGEAPAPAANLLRGPLSSPLPLPRWM